MKKPILPFLLLLSLLFSGCTDTGPEGPVIFNPLYQGSLSGVPTMVVHASQFNPSDQTHWKHLEDYGEWAVKRILGTGSNGIVYMVDTQDVDAPTDTGLSEDFRKHTIATIAWVPTQEAKVTRDPFGTQKKY